MGKLSLEAFRGASLRPGSKCVVGTLRQSLDAEDLAALDAALADEDITAAAISRTLHDEGHRVAAQSVSNHRRGDCRCPKEEA